MAEPRAHAAFPAGLGSPASPGSTEHPSERRAPTSAPVLHPTPRLEAKRWAPGTRVQIFCLGSPVSSTLAPGVLGRRSRTGSSPGTTQPERLEGAARTLKDCNSRSADIQLKSRGRTPPASRPSLPLGSPLSGLRARPPVLRASPLANPLVIPAGASAPRGEGC